MSGLNLAELDNLEKRELQLSILAAVIVLVMAGGVALLMYPLVFDHPEAGNRWTMRFAFVGFCVLSVLFVAYLLDRQRTVRELKQQLVAELKRNVELRRQGNVDLLQSMPDINHFQDRLMMEFRRASNMKQPLSLLIVKLKFPPNSADKDAVTALQGEAARAISHLLRPSDSMYVFGAGLFGLVLSETETPTAKGIKARIGEALRAIGSDNRFSSETQLWNYPDHVKSAHELEEHVTSLLPEATMVGKL
jgi:GGDEF domain-containing protein